MGSFGDNYIQYTRDEWNEKMFLASRYRAKSISYDYINKNMYILVSNTISVISDDGSHEVLYQYNDNYKITNIVVNPYSQILYFSTTDWRINKYDLKTSVYSKLDLICGFRTVFAINPIRNLLYYATLTIPKVTVVDEFDNDIKIIYSDDSNKYGLSYDVHSGYLNSQIIDSLTPENIENEIQKCLTNLPIELCYIIISYASWNGKVINKI